MAKCDVQSLYKNRDDTNYYDIMNDISDIKKYYYYDSSILVLFNTIFIYYDPLDF